jgi:hypothetical protein
MMKPDVRREVPMVIKIERELEQALTERARQQGLSPEALALATLRDRFLGRARPVEPQDEWERRLLEAASDCGVSLSNLALSSEGLYD